MADTRLSNCFHYNEFFWKLFGLWPGRASSKYYKYYSFLYLFVTLLIYDIALTLNLIYTPRKIELLIREVIFYFTEVAVASKVLMILFKRKQILKCFEVLDCDFFKGNDDVSKKIVESSGRKYLFAWKFYAVFSNLAYSVQVVFPIFFVFLLDKTLELPICKYYFLSDETRDNYFVYWYLYQSFGMFGHMMCNVNIDSFVSGLIFCCVTQLKVINHKMINLKISTLESKKKHELQEKIMMMKLNECLKHYGVVLDYCNIIQEIMNISMFVQFGMSSIIICVVLCGLTMNQSTAATIFLMSYLCAMTSQIFVPGWLGTELSFENQSLAFAAYKSEWIPRSERFKRSLRLFVEKTNVPLVLKGLKMFPLDLGTFTSIMKTAYSFFTLIRNVQNRQNQH